jgi:hypothetical protein
MKPFGREPAPSRTNRIQDRAGVLMHAVRQVPLAQMKPDPFDRVELWRVGRQPEQRDTGRDGEVVTGIGNHHRMLVLRQSSRKSAAGIRSSPRWGRWAALGRNPNRWLARRSRRHRRMFSADQRVRSACARAATSGGRLGPSGQIWRHLGKIVRSLCPDAP